MLRAAGVVFAALAGVAPAAGEEAASLAVSAGTYEVFRDGAVAEGGLEIVLRPLAWGLRPTVGAMANEDSAVLVYAGARRDFAVHASWFITPGFALAAYDRGDSKDLGSTLEFRSSLEVAYRLDARSRLGLAVYHLSNAGIDVHNPGANSLILTYRLAAAAGGSRGGDS